MHTVKKQSLFVLFLIVLPALVIRSFSIKPEKSVSEFSTANNSDIETISALPLNAVTQPHAADKQTGIQTTTTTRLDDQALVTEASEIINSLLQSKRETHLEKPMLFTGNSNYTGDDTEDNDAGNTGFEDDFPERVYAADNHAAEAYVNYTESYIDNNGVVVID